MQKEKFSPVLSVTAKPLVGSSGGKRAVKVLVRPARALISNLNQKIRWPPGAGMATVPPALSRTRS